MAGAMLRAPTRSSPPPLPLPPTVHIACVQVPDAVDHRDRRGGGDGDEAWLAACYRVTPRLERVSATCVLLDFGTCTDDEAMAVAEQLFRHLAALDGERTPVQAQARASASVRIGIGASVLGAQMAVAHMALGRPVGDQAAGAASMRGAARAAPAIQVLSAAEGQAAIRALPVRKLPLLHPAGTVPQEVVERLERYGLRTLGQVARVNEAALRRQFGERMGTTLAALAAGHDLRPLLPTPQPATLRCRMVFASGASADRVLAALGAGAEQIARRLGADGRQTGRLRLMLTWQSGGVSAGEVRLRTPTAEARVLAQQVSDLCRTLLLAAPEARVETDPDDPYPITIPDALNAPAAAPGGAPLMERVLVEVGDLMPLSPAQATFWRTAAQRQAVARQVAETLARRFGGKPQLVHAPCAVPHAIIPSERYRWLPVESADERETRHLPSSALQRRNQDQALGRGSASTDLGAGSAWADVPYRLHWW